MATLQDLLMNVPAMLLLTVGSYLLGVWVKTRSGLSLLHPFLISIPVIISVLVFADIPCTFYMESNAIIDFMLGPSVVSLGLLLYDHRKTVAKNLVGIMSSVVAGAVTGVASVYFLCRVLGLPDLFVHSLAPKSVTTPIAMELSTAAGGNASLTAVSVIICGFVGAVVGPSLLKLFRFRSPVAKGLALGCCSHGLGTARAIELGAVEGALSGLAIALMGVVTALVVPFFSILAD